MSFPWMEHPIILNVPYNLDDQKCKFMNLNPPHIY
jgi:hypothetical protein